jgi:prepilin-type N-terminal cleavage/methylation domain-containing protein
MKTLPKNELKITKKAFTLIEVIVVMVIIAIAAVLAVPMMSSAADIQVRSAANMIAADLEYTKSMAISRQQNHWVVFDTANESYEVHDPCGVIDHPIKAGSPFVVDLANDSRLSRVDIVSADFDSQLSVTFDYLGSPYSGTTTNPLNSGQISLQAASFTMTVNVEPMTGYITVQ